MKMTQVIKKFLLILVVTGMAFGLSACGNNEEEVIQNYVQQELDSAYKNIHHEDLVALYEGTISEEDLSDYYVANVTKEVEMFLGNYSIYLEELSEETFTGYYETFVQIYNALKYEVVAIEGVDGGYLVTINIHPVDILEITLRDNDYANYIGEYETGNYDAFAAGLLADIQSNLANMGYSDVQEVQTVVLVSDDGVISLDSTFWVDVDTHMISYEIE